jgi:hypothetical protein
MILFHIMSECGLPEFLVTKLSCSCNAGTHCGPQISVLCIQCVKGRQYTYASVPLACPLFFIHSTQVKSGNRDLITVCTASIAPSDWSMYSGFSILMYNQIKSRWMRKASNVARMPRRGIHIGFWRENKEK